MYFLILPNKISSINQFLKFHNVTKINKKECTQYKEEHYYQSLRKVIKIVIKIKFFKRVHLQDRIYSIKY